MKTILRLLFLPYLFVNVFYFGVIIIQYAVLGRVVIYAYQFKVAGVVFFVFAAFLYFAVRTRITWRSAGLRTLLEGYLLFAAVDTVVKLAGGPVANSAILYAANYFYFYVFVVFLLLVIYWDVERRSEGAASSRVWMALYAIAVPVLVFGFLQFVLNDHLYLLPDDAEYEAKSYRLIDEQIRSLSIFSSGYEYGHFITLVAVVARAFILTSKTRRRQGQVISWIMLVLGAGAVLTTVTRNVVVYFFLSVFAVGFIHRAVRRRWSNFLIVSVSAGLGLALLVAMIVVLSSASTMGEGALSLRTFDQRVAYQSFYIAEYFLGAEDFTDVLFGYGLMQGRKFSELNGSEYIIFDNTYLAVALYSGLVGLTLFLTLFVTLFRFILNEYRKTKHYAWLALAGIYFAFPPVAAINAFISILLVETCIIVAFYILRLKIHAVGGPKAVVLQSC